MTRAPDLGSAVAILRLLLDDPWIDPDDLDWTELRGVAERGAVIVRLADHFARRGERVPPCFGAAAVAARTRTERLLMVADQIGQACRRHGIDHAFLKVVERFPDAGSDLDLLVATDVDRLLLQDLPASPGPRRLRSRLSGAATYTVAGDVVLDVHHGRLGQFGEHARFASLLLRRRRLATLRGITCFAPSPEDHLLLQAVQQVYTRPAFRLADLYWTIARLREGHLDGSYLFGTARALGLSPILTSYLDYVIGVYRRVRGRPTPRLRSRDLRFPTVRLAGRLYLRHVRAALRLHDWASAGRLCFLPVLAVRALR